MTPGRGAALAGEPGRALDHSAEKIQSQCTASVGGGEGPDDEAMLALPRSPRGAAHALAAQLGSVGFARAFTELVLAELKREVIR